jgi:hypothetical protein
LHHQDTENTEKTETPEYRCHIVRPIRFRNSVISVSWW